MKIKILQKNLIYLRITYSIYIVLKFEYIDNAIEAIYFYISIKIQINR